MCMCVFVCGKHPFHVSVWAFDQSFSFVRKSHLHIYIMYEIHRSLFIYTGLFWHTLYISVRAIHTFTCISCISHIQVFFHTYTGLFSHIQVSFHIYRSLFTYTGLFSHIQVSFCIYRSFLIHIKYITSSEWYLRMYISYEYLISFDVSDIINQCCSVLQWVAVSCSVLQCVAVSCSELQCVAASCSELQCLAVCCPCVAVCSNFIWCIWYNTSMKSRYSWVPLSLSHTHTHTYTHTHTQYRSHPIASVIEYPHFSHELPHEKLHGIRRVSNPSTSIDPSSLKIGFSWY